jgi:hypothetical protein
LTVRHGEASSRSGCRVEQAQQLEHRQVSD